MADRTPLRLFYSYAHADEALRDELEKHLKLLERENVIAPWHDREITAGSEWADHIKANLDAAHIILLLVSVDFVASDYCWDNEMQRAMERHKAGTARVIPVILRKCDWRSAPFGKLQALPKNAEPVTSSKWANEDEAFTDVAAGIRRAAAEILGNPR